MPGTDVDDGPTMKELFRHFVDFREEYRADKAQMVRKDVHSVEHEALIARLARQDQEIIDLKAGHKEIRTELVAKEKERTTIRNQYYFSVVGAVLSFVVAVGVAVVK